MVRGLEILADLTRVGEEVNWGIRNQLARVKYNVLMEFI